MLKAGCQTPWSRVNVEGVPVCDNSSLLEKYSNTYWKAVDMDRHKLLEYTNCLMPCTFMEYEVSFIVSMCLLCPFKFPGPDKTRLKCGYT